MAFDFNGPIYMMIRGNLTVPYEEVTNAIQHGVHIIGDPPVLRTRSLRTEHLLAHRKTQPNSRLAKRNGNSLGCSHGMVWATLDWLEPKEVTAMVPNWGMSYIPETILPALKASGVTDDQIHTMMVENPRRLFDR